jgi:hypothetical protein
MVSKALVPILHDDAVEHQAVKERIVQEVLLYFKGEATLAEVKAICDELAELEYKRFWKRVNKRGPMRVRRLGRCWTWRGRLNQYGYGRFTRNNGASVMAHRFSWEIVNGDMPQNAWALHRCDNPSCVRPSHIFPGTALENAEDARRKGRIPVGEQRHNAKLTAAAVRYIRTSTLSVAELADRYGVTRYTIYNVRKRIVWKHVA